MNASAAVVYLALAPALSVAQAPVDTAGLARYVDSLATALLAERPYLAPGTPAPRLEATDLDGYAVAVRDFDVVYLFAMLACPPCDEVFAEAAAHGFRLADGRRLVYLNAEDELSRLRQHFAFEYPGVDVPVYHVSRESRRAYGGISLPMLVELDRYSRVVAYDRTLAPWRPR